MGSGRPRLDIVELENHQGTRHPWETARFRFFALALEREGILQRARSILDVGAGDGWFAAELARRAPHASLTCWDVAYATHPPVNREHFPPNVHLHVSATRPEGRADLVLLLDVLEHVEDDAAFLADLVERSVEPGGHLLVSVPAWPALLSSHDARLRHHRRYRPSLARALLRSTGLEVVRRGGLFHSLLLPRGLQVLRERASGRPHPPDDLGAWKASKLTTALVGAALRCDTAVSSLAAAMRCELHGLSWWAICRKPLR